VGFPAPAVPAWFLGPLAQRQGGKTISISAKCGHEQCRNPTSRAALTADSAIYVEKDPSAGFNSATDMIVSVNASTNTAMTYKDIIA
jgi:hypothetical protein